jgi:hypothetical protein
MAAINLLYLGLVYLNLLIVPMAAEVYAPTAFAGFLRCFAISSLASMVWLVAPRLSGS